MEFSLKKLYPIETYRLLYNLPSWVDKSSSSEIFKYFNLLGSSLAFTADKIEELKHIQTVLNFNFGFPHQVYFTTLDKSPDQNTNIYGIKSEETGDVGTYLQRQDNLYDFLYSAPDSIKFNEEFQVTFTSKILDMVYVHNLFDADKPGFVFLVEGHPAVNPVIELRDLDFNIVSTVPSIGYRNQSYGNTGYDEIVDLDSNNQYTLKYTPIKSTVKVYDVLNLTDGTPTDVTSDFSLLDKTLTWTGTGNPNGKYIVEYDYAGIQNIISIAPSDYIFNYALSKDTDDLPVRISPLDGYSYNEDLSTGIDSAVNYTLKIEEASKPVNPLEFKTSVQSGTTYYYLYFHPEHVKAGASVDVTLNAVKLSSADYLYDGTNPISITIADASAVTESGVYIYEQGTQNRIPNESCTITINGNTVDIVPPASYSGNTLTVNIYYSSSITNSYSASAATDKVLELKGKNYYANRIDVTDLVNQSVEVPTVVDFSVTKKYRYTKHLFLKDINVVDDKSGYISVYLDSVNNELILSNTTGNTEEKYHFNIDYSQDPIILNVNPNRHYLDATFYYNYLVVLEVDATPDSNTVYGYSHANHARLLFFDLDSREIKRIVYINSGNPVSITTDYDSIYILDYDNQSNIHKIRKYQFEYLTYYFDDSVDPGIIYLRERFDKIKMETN